MDWDEFTDLLAGLGSKTPLVEMAKLRLEDDPEILKHYSQAQKRERARWRNRSAKRKTEEEMNAFLSQIQAIFERNYGDKQN